MKLTFLGTRGEIEKRTRRHRMHTSLMVSYRAADVMIDCGLDWLGNFGRWRYRNAFVHSKTRQSAHWAFAGSHPIDMVRKRRRTASHHHALRLGDCHRRRGPDLCETPSHGRRPRRRDGYRLRWNEAEAL